ncbi:hypothetical protein JCM14469_29750 [Desulfatiferula olefinivorans]
MTVTEASLTPERIQTKADILENNLFQDLKKSDSEATARLRVDREGTLDVIVEKALAQVLFRVNIHPSVVLDKLSEALAQTRDKAAPVREIRLPIRAATLDQGDRILDIRVAYPLIDVVITGLKPQIEQHEEIVKYYFEPKKHPGKLLPNGKIDFRELHQFPAVAQGDKLMLIRYPVPGRPGVTFDGRIIPVAEPRVLDLVYGEGVRKQNHLDADGRAVGYFLTAAKTGVILLKQTAGQIREIDVTDLIELETIDFSIGNIGSEFISPVSMKIGTVNDGFRIRAHGRMEVQCLDGGHVITDDEAVIDQIRPHSTAQARLGITANTVVDSELICSEGPITITNELRDARIRGAEVTFKTSRGSMLNATVDACTLTFQNVYYCGTNKIYLGRDLFSRRLGIIDDLAAVDKSHQDVQNAIDSIKSRLLNGLKTLASQITDADLLNMFRLLIHSLQAFTFSDAYKVLANLRERMNVTPIDQLTRTFQELEKLSQAILAYTNRKNELTRALNQTEVAINGIRCVLHGKINPTATIQIYCGKTPSDEPIHEIKPLNRDTNESLAFSASYHLEFGFKTK